MSAQPEVTTPNRRHRVVVIGSGFGGLNAVKKLKRADVDIKLIARTTHHLFQPLLYQVATGIISEGEIAPATRVILRRQRNVQVLLGDVTHIDLSRKVVISDLLGHSYETPYDSLIVAAGAGQSYFGNDHFAEFAPGMKSIDDALELRGRILSAFEAAERSNDPERRRKLLTFTVVGAGPTGVEMAGQIAELADYTLKGAFRHIDSARARVILLDAAPAVLPPFGDKLGRRAAARLEKMGVEIQLGAMVTDIDRDGITVKDSDGSIRRIESACKVWSAGVSASSLGRDLARQSAVELDRAGRVKVQPDLSLPGHPNVFVIGDMAAVDGVPGVAQGAIQGAKYAATAIKAELGGANPAEREPFQYFDKGSMATRCRGFPRGWPRSVRAGIQRFHCLVGVAGPAPGLSGWVQDQGQHVVVVDSDVPEHSARPADDHRAASLRPHPARAARGDGCRGARGRNGESGQLAGLGFEVLQPHLTAGHQAFIRVGDGDHPQLLTTPAMYRGRGAVDHAAADGTQEVGVVIDADDRTAAVGAGARRVGGDAGHALDHRAVDTAVHDAHRLQQRAATSKLACSAVRTDFGEYQPQFLVERCL